MAASSQPALSTAEALALSSHFFKHNAGLNPGPGLATAQALALELYYQPHLCLQSSLKMQLLTPDEMAALEVYFGVEQSLKAGKITRAIERMRQIMMSFPLSVFAGMNMQYMVRQMLQSGFANRATQALSVAVRCGRLEMVELLLQHSADYDVSRALEEAADYGRLEIVTLLLAYRPRNVNSALYNACRRGHSEVAELLLQAGAYDYNTALQGAVRGNLLEMVRRLLALGVNHLGEPLRLAAAHCRLEMLELLLDALPRDTISQYYIEDAAADVGCLQVLARLLKAGAANYQRMMRYAVGRGKLEVVRFLSDYGVPGAIGDASDYGGPGASASPAHIPITYSWQSLAEYAASVPQSTAAVLEFILAQGPVDLENVWPSACGLNKLEMVRLLLDRCAISDLNRALELVCSKNHLGSEGQPTLELLVEAGATDLNPALVTAAANANFKAVGFLVARGATALNEAMVACVPYRKGIKTASFLLDAGADDINGALRVLDETDTRAAFVELLRHKGRLPELP